MDNKKVLLKVKDIAIQDLENIGVSGILIVKENGWEIWVLNFKERKSINIQTQHSFPLVYDN